MIDDPTRAGLLFIFLGIVLILLRDPISVIAASLYRKLGISVPADSYARQFMFIGILTILVGLLTTAGLLSLL